MQRFAFALFFLCAALLGQRAEFVNHSQYAVTGWQRVTIDTPPPYAAGRVGDVRYVVAHPIGLDVQAVDVHLALAPGQRRVVDFTQATPEAHTLAPLPADIGTHFGGPLTIGGSEAQLVRLAAEGAAFRAEFVARFGATFCARAWLLWYPDHPATAQGELVLVSSNPTSALLTEGTTSPVRIAFGDALVWSVGSGFGGRVLAAGDWLADGQGRFVPFALCWTRHLSSETAWGNALSLALAPHNLGVCGVGIERLIHEGKPRMPAGFNVAGWITRHWPRVCGELTTWAPSELGCSIRSADSGAQEVQTYHVGGEAMLADGVGAERVRYLNALRLHAGRPMNHLRLNGEGVLGSSPGLLFANGGPHYHPSVNSDARGKPRNPVNGYLEGPTMEQTHGFGGPDTQHHYAGDLAAVARLVASPAAQWLLERHATVYLLQRTEAGTGSTAATWAAREWACEADLVLHLWRNMSNRALADQVVARWRNRVAGVLLPALATKDVIVVWQNEPRINANGPGVQWWQESFAAAAVWRTCDVVGPVAGKAAAERIARHVLAVAWQADGAGWRAQAQGPADGSANAENPATHSMDGYGMPCAAWLVRKLEPGHVKANAVWSQLVSEEAGAFRWMLP